MKNRFIFALIALAGVVCPLWAAPVPTVYWDGDFDTTQKTGSDGLVYTFNRNGNTVSGGKMTVGSSAGLVSWSKSAGTKLTVLVKYSSLAASSALNTLLSLKTSADDDLGVRANAAGTLTLVGYRTGAGSTVYGSKDAVSGAGYVSLSCDGANGTVFATGSQEGNLSLSSNAGLKSSGTMSGVALGGPHASTAYPAWSGVVIEAVAIFRDVYFSNVADLRDYRFPSENVTYAATVSGDVANLQTDPNIAWTGTPLPDGGAVDAAVTFQMAAASTMTLSKATEFYSLALTGAGKTIFDSASKLFSAQILDLSDFAGSVDAWPAVSLSAVASIKLGSAATAVLHVDGTASRTLSGQLLGSGNLVKDGDGVLLVSGANNALTGVMTVRDGTLKSTADGAVGASVAVTGTGLFDLNGKKGVKTLSLSGAGDGAKTFAALQVNSDGAERLGALTLSGDATVTNAVTLAVGSDDASAAKATLNGHTLVKVGAGDLDLRNMSTDAGTLDIGGGKLTVSGQGNLGGETALVIRPGASFEGKTTDAEDISIKSVLNDGTVTGDAQLLVSEFAGGSGSYKKLSLAAGAKLMPTDATSPLTVTDALTLPASGFVLDATKIATDIAASAGQSVKALQTPTQITDAQITALVHDSSFAWTTKSETSGSGYLLSLVPSATRQRLEWVGGSGDWTATAFDGLGGYSDEVRQNVTFGDAKDGSEDPLTVTIVSGPRTVTRVVFSNETRAVTLTGERLEAYSLEKKGTGDVTVSAPLTLSGGIVLETGTLVIDVPAGETATVVGPITGAGDLVKTGDGTLVVSGGSGSWTGALTVSGGVARCGSEVSFGVNEIRIEGGTIDLNGVYLRNELALSGEGFEGNGALVNGGADILGAVGLAGVRLLGDATIGGDAGAYYWNGKTLDLAGYTLTKKGTFRWPLRANAFTSGRIVVEDGVFDTNQGENDLSAVSLSVQTHGSLVLGGVKTTVKDFRCTSAATGHATLEVLGLFDADGVACTIPVLAFAEGATLKGDGLTVSDSLTFGALLNVHGLGCGSSAMRYLADEPTGYDTVGVRVLGDLSRLYSFSYDGDAKSLVIVANPIAPTFDLTDTKVVYGVDMTNAVVTFAISDYQAGAGYAEDPQALLTVRDASGRVVAQRGVVITGDGTYAFGAVDMLDGRGAGYSYDIAVTIRQSSLTGLETLTGSGTSEYVVHTHSGWIDEDAETFQKPTGDPSKTGEWTYGAGDAYVEDDLIVHGVTGGNLVFTPKTPSSQDVARVAATILVEDGTDMPSVTDLPANAHAAFAVAAEGSGLVFVALTPALADPVRLYSTGARPDPVAGTRCTVCADFNYAQGTVTFTENGNALTNAAGSAFLPISEAGLAAKSLKGVTFAGLGRLATLEGTELNANLAKANGTEYEAVDAAVAALPKGGTIEMLWEALWHPTTADFGNRYVFTGDHSVVLDPGATNELARAGYAVVSNGDGSYTVNVIEYTLTFTVNGASAEEDYTQLYSATNLVFNLLANRFSATNALDFAHWNAAADGSAPTNYLDGATIDMSEYGFTNMTLYAQWKVAVRTVTVATPDPNVYLELVTTNAPYDLPATHQGVKFFRTSGPGSEVSASFGVAHGSRVTLYFSTDIEKQLTSGHLNYSQILRDRTIGYTDLPKIVTALGSRALSEYERWANAKGIAASDFAASPYAMASYDLDTDALLTEKTVVTLADFAVLADGCSFRVLIDGVALCDRAAIADMILVSDDLKNWVAPPEGAVTVEGETVRVRTTGTGKFVKVVVPRD